MDESEDSLVDEELLTEDSELLDEDELLEDMAARVEM